MNIKTVFKAIAAVALLALAFSCTKGFEALNQDQFGVHKEQMSQDGLELGGMLQALQRSVFIHEDGTYLDSDYQRMYNLLAETWCGYMSPTMRDGKFAGWDLDSDDEDKSVRAMFVNKYTYGLGSFTQYNDYAVANELLNERALGLVLKVATMHMVTDYYGPIAYSQYGSMGGNLYDSQEKVYQQFFAELDEAIPVLETAALVGDQLIPDYDLVYGGDAGKWARFANSLRLRLAMRIAYADPALAQQEAEKSILSSSGVITDNSGNAIETDVTRHPLYTINITFNDADTQIGASLDCYLNGFNDPRKFKYAKEAKDGQLHGVRYGFLPSSGKWEEYKNSEKAVSAPNATEYKLCWMNAAEVAFLRAEGALRGWNMGGSAKDFYETGIRLSFEEWGASGAEAYLADNTLTPAAFTDNVASNGSPAPSNVTIAWKESDNTEQKLEKIATQKWIALFPNGVEAWAEYRRLHYPGLVPPVNNYSNGVVNTTEGIRRVQYPTAEETDNKAGYDSGVAALGGPDNAGTRLWWDQKPF